MEVKRMEQNERRYGADRDELMRSIIGLDSGLVSLDQANREGVPGLDPKVSFAVRNLLTLSQSKKKRRPDEDTPSRPPSPGPPAKKARDQAAWDQQQCIYRLPPPTVAANSSHLASKHPVHQPAHLRSTKMPAPKANSAIRITELLGEMGLSTHRLVMPTRTNLEAYDGVLSAATSLIDMKRQVDRVEQEIRTLKAQKDGFVPPVEAARTRSESVLSTDTSGTNRRSRA